MEILKYIKNTSPELYDFVTSTPEEFFKTSLKNRRQMFGVVSEIEHCERELLAQRSFLKKELYKSIHEPDFFTRMMYVKISECRKAIVDYFEDTLEDLSHPEVPFINSLFNLKTSPLILDRYYAMMPQPSKDTILPSYIAMPHHRINSPYRVMIEGAYPLMKDYEGIQYRIDNKVEPFNEVLPDEINEAFKRYGKGFRKGYYRFENNLLGGEDETIVLKNENYRKLIYDFVFANLFWKGGFSISYGSRHYLEGWGQDGFDGGMYYRAWYLMVKYYYVFEPLFLTTATNSVSISTTDDEAILQAESFNRATIDDYLIVFKENDSITTDDYERLTKLLLDYFEDRKLSSGKIISVLSGNTKKLAYALYELHRKGFKKDVLTYDYLNMAHINISCFKNHKPDKDNFTKGSLYKYFTTKPQ